MKTQANCQIVIQLQKLLSNPGATWWKKKNQNKNLVDNSGVSWALVEKYRERPEGDRNQRRFLTPFSLMGHSLE